MDLDALRREWRASFDELRSSGIEYDADHPIAKRYREASDNVNHALRKAEAEALARVGE